LEEILEHLDSNLQRRLCQHFVHFREASSSPVCNIAAWQCDARVIFLSALLPGSGTQPFRPLQQIDHFFVAYLIEVGVVKADSMKVLRLAQAPRARFSLPSKDRRKDLLVLGTSLPRIDSASRRGIVSDISFDGIFTLASEI
jgi:hypothetical protein